MMERNRRGFEGSTPSIRIIEQPASKALRFRYECEGRSAGSIPGVNSTPENKTYPTIKIDNYRGRATVLVSCVTKDPPYRAHPHNLVGKERCKKGVCIVEVDSETMTATFSNLGIQCVKKKDVEQALIDRENLRIDPFKNGFSHKTQAGMIDLNAVRLCFQVFLEGPGENEFKRPLYPPVVSDPIYDKKAMTDLVICKLSDCSASVAGGKEIILLCEKVTKEDISVRFYEEKDGNIVWEGWGDFTPTHVHKQFAISFRTPRYKTLEVDYPVQVYIQLMRPSDKATSAPLPFQLTSLDADPVNMKRKKVRISNNTSQELFKHLQENEQLFRVQSQQGAGQSDISQIKLEPNYAIGKLSPIHHSPMPSPPYGGPSGYQPSVYQPPTPPVLQNYGQMQDHLTFAPHNVYNPVPVYPPSPMHNVQQVDVQMTPMEISPILHPLLPVNQLSPQLQNNLNAPQMTGLHSNVLQPINDLSSSVPMNQMSPQPQPPQQTKHESDELNTPTVSATGIDEHNDRHNNAYGGNGPPHISGDIESLLADMGDPPQNISQNLSNLTFD